jgi:hypothetical protein
MSMATGVPVDMMKRRREREREREKVGSAVKGGGEGDVGRFELN